MVILLPAAGNGSRFREAGYERPKPYIEVGRTIMLAKVIECLTDLQFFEAKLIIIVQKEHQDQWSQRKILETEIKRLWRGYFKVIEINGLTEGAVATTLLASKYLANEEELIITNSDQYLDDWDAVSFVNSARQFDGSLLTFISDGDPKWSYVETAEYNNVTLVDRVEEKMPLAGNIANVGLYYFRSGLLYLNAAAAMIQKDIRVNGEFYISKVYSELLRQYQISNYMISAEKMLAMGTPKDLQETIKKMDW